MQRIKKIVLISIFLFFCNAYAQEKETVYLSFDLNSSETCKVPKEGGGYLNINKYQKIKSQNKKYKYRFYICKELFVFKSFLKPDTCTIKYLKNIKTSKIEDLNKIVEVKNPLYPSKVFEKVYLVEKINDSTIIKYDVEWKYYIN